MQGPRGFELHVDSGGFWLLDLDRNPSSLIGRRVVVEGIRTGFDRLDVERIEVEVGQERTESTLRQNAVGSISRNTNRVAAGLAVTILLFVVWHILQGLVTG